MSDAQRMVVAGVVALIGLVGLYVAAITEQMALYWGGMTLFVFAVVFVFMVIKQIFDAREAAQNHRDGHDERA